MTVWMLDKSAEWVAGAESETGQSSDAVWASQLLSDDLMRWSRWWLGLGAFVVAFFAAGTAGTLGMLLVLDGSDDEGPVVVVVGILVVAVATLAGCGVVLWRLHRSGRRLARALRWWLGLRAVAVPSRGFAGWLAPRAVLFKPVVFVRVLTATLSGLIGIFGLSMIGYSLTQEAMLLLASILWGLLGTACCVGQLGGVMRLVCGLADDDPLWSTVG
ncbi:hypothetical protein [Kribbella sindirgiensis]|uniref:Uncharacterized protein n=1 Tax=Kribbella sindirgiensis TaxID=1124744 RepID=A0A4R0HXV1_9ACTN|nr:hypothetical protein [Kribbella sindirgiensis]TCC17905.1 hypothetical protein E0H50_38935 [Kribbella sindirgiensis]